jgi:4-carboxymuconolactone decarboxylase
LGVGSEQISAVQRDDLQAECFDSDARVLLGFTAQVLERPRADEETFTTLRERFPPRQIVELLLVIGSYHMLARLMTTLDLELEPAAAVIDKAHQQVKDWIRMTTRQVSS